MSDWLDKKLEDARNHAAGYGMKRGRQATSDDRVKGVYADLYDEAPSGSVAERDAWVRRQARYKDAIVTKQNDYAEWETARLYMQILFAECDKYRTDRATERAMDRAHT